MKNPFEKMFGGKPDEPEEQDKVAEKEIKGIPEQKEGGEGDIKLRLSELYQVFDTYNRNKDRADLTPEVIQACGEFLELYKSQHESLDLPNYYDLHLEDIENIARSESLPEAA